MPKLYNCIKTIGITGFLMASVLSAVNAQVIVSPVVTFSSGLYNYNYTITNNSTDDLFDLSIHVPAQATAIKNLSAPAGFISAFDPGLGLVDYLEDTSTFALGVPISGFKFSSPYAPVAGIFDANLFTTSGSINTFSGKTVAPAPEPGSIALLGAGAVASGLLFNRFRRRTRRS